MDALNPQFMAQFRAARPSVTRVLTWINKLRSGTYTQITGSLRTLDDCYCALGVVVAPHLNPVELLGSNYEHLYDLLGCTGPRFKATPIYAANDINHWTFDQIADWLETAINLQRTIDLLQSLPDERFSMKEWRTGPGGARADYLSDEELTHDCGTAACIAGWAAVFNTTQMNSSSSYRARLALGIDDVQTDHLFVPPRMRTRTRLEAIQVLTQFRDTGEISWT